MSENWSDPHRVSVYGLAAVPAAGFRPSFAGALLQDGDPARRLHQGCTSPTVFADVTATSSTQAALE